MWQLLQVQTKLLKVSLIYAGSALQRDFLKFVDVKLYCFIALLRLHCGSSWLSMNIFNIMTALLSGERISHTDTFIFAGVNLALFVGSKTFRKRMQSKD